MNRKRWTALFLVLAVFVLGIGVESIFGGIRNLTDHPEYAWDEHVVSGSGTAKIVQLYVNGTITSERSTASVTPMADLLTEQIRRIEEDEQVKAVVLRIESPGGEVVATDELHRRLLQLKELRQIPLVVSMGSTAASGGYYLATAGDAIFANPNTLTGSLGVIFTLTNYSNAIHKLGIQEYAIKSGRFKDIGSPARPLTEPERQIFQTLVNQSYDRFVDVIVKGRSLPRERVLQIADGRIYSGEQAKRLGLVDRFGDLEDATRYALTLTGLPEAQIVRFTENISLGNLIFRMQRYWSNPDPLGLERILQQGSTPKLLYQFIP
ncbi:signal peptide peptidase SppA [Brevibacillus borstelensis]|uniref:signal peptide peptidase SppA n=1 Tax=Brevibacillus borstelensis TaxID=45462 RepID=UPI002040CF37|nr:signal peptide peptidase SppA [Brevibacillus borstelensis]MCM3471877.1 signal peptide peptidase SppA [Brevibacillus borstelensis]